MMLSTAQTKATLLKYFEILLFLSLWFSSLLTDGLKSTISPINAIIRTNANDVSTA